MEFHESYLLERKRASLVQDSGCSADRVLAQLAADSMIRRGQNSS